MVGIMFIEDHSGFLERLTSKEEAIGIVLLEIMVAVE